MLKFKTDLSRPTIIVMGAVSALVIAALGFIIYSYVSPKKAPASSIVKYQGTKKSDQTTKAESEQYQKQLNKYNVKNSEYALQTDKTSYIAVPSLREETVVLDASNQQKVLAPKTKANSTVQTVQTAQQKSVEQAQKEAANIIAGLQENWDISPPSFATAVDVGDYATAFQPAATLSNATTNGVSQMAIAATVPPFQIMEPFKMCPARIIPQLNTDVNSVVTVDLLCEKLKGARAYAPGYRLVGDNIDMTFTTMAWGGAVYNITAKPMDLDTGRTMLSGEVDHRYISRIVVPALALGVAKAGKLYEDATGTDTAVSNGTVVQSTPDKVSKDRVMGSFIGGLGQQTANVMNADAARIPPIKVEKPGNSTIGVVFLSPLMNTDRTDVKVSTSAATQPSQGQTAIPGNNESSYSLPAGADQATEQRKYINDIQQNQDHVLTNQY